ncbi:MAG TPA: ABC transporter permease [Bryobacteraceae bacterium]|nr:ABC transporter permease [Bryobacteraceae bacterium]
MMSVFEDLRYSLRGLRKSPLFTIVALASLALGIGANTAVFSLMDQALLRSLPVKHPEQLVLFYAAGPRRGMVNTSYDDKLTFSYPMYRDFRDGNQVFSGVLARFPISFSMTWHDETDRIHGDLVSGNYFEVLGVNAAMGRTFSADDDRTPGGHPVVVLSYNFWQRRFGSDPSVLNQTILLNAHPMTIVGVAQRGFKSVGVGESADVFVPMMMESQMMPGSNDLEKRRSLWLNIIARLKPGIVSRQAEAAMNAFWKPILEMEVKEMPNAPQTTRNNFLARHLSLLSARKGVSGPQDSLSTAMTVLMIMVGLLLLIACANVANLLIARATARQREIGIRLALGASRFRMVRQLLAESLLLSLSGGVLGLLAADWTGDGLLRLMPADPSVAGFSSHPDARIFLFTLALSIFTGVLFGIVPALQGTRTQLATTLKDQATGVLGGFGHLRLRKSLVVTQVALSLMLLIGAGLFARSLYNAKNIQTGFRTDHLISFSVQPSLNGYSQERIRGLLQNVQADMVRIPGVRAASMSEMTLLSGDNEQSSIEVLGYHAREDEDMVAWVNHVGPGYFATMGIPLLVGREFTNADGATAPKVAVVNEKFATYFFKNENPIGRRVKIRANSDVMEIVGVVKDSKASDLREKQARFFYAPYTQTPVGSMTFYARTSQDPSAVTPMLRDVVRRQDANLPIFGVKTMDRQIDESLFMDRLVAMLSAAFGILATVLAAVGLYGVMAFMVVRRTREIGIRMALGADRKTVLRLVMKEVLLLASIGVCIAVVASLALGRLVESQLLDVSGRDPWVIAAATVTLSGVALLAGFIPAMRATRVDPLSALRYE